MAKRHQNNPPAVVPLRSRVDRLWEEWVEARNTSMRTATMADCKAAGRAYAAMMDEFLPPDKRSQDAAGNYISLEERVIAFRTARGQA